MPKSQQFNLTILRQSAIWGAADEAVLHTALLYKKQNQKKSPVSGPVDTSLGHTMNSVINMCNTSAHTHTVDLMKE